jgi:hypothetical protein
MVVSHTPKRKALFRPNVDRTCGGFDIIDGLILFCGIFLECVLLKFSEVCCFSGLVVRDTESGEYLIIV